MGPNDQESSTETRWWSQDTVAVVTGANRGIGFALVKKLAELGLTVILTSRDVSRGIRAVECLQDQGLHVEYSRLDVADPTSIKEFASWLEGAFGGLDILVNNAAVSFNDIHENSVDHAETVIRSNFRGPRLLTEALLPLFRRSASVSRILNISSRLGLLKRVSNQAIRELLSDDEGLSEEMIEDVVDRFLDQVRRGTWAQQGWPDYWTDYSVSKLALNAYSLLLAKRHEGRGLSVNCFCPGFTKTDMTRGQGNRTADDAAATGAQLILLPPDELPTGKFFTHGKTLVYSRL